MSRPTPNATEIVAGLTRYSADMPSGVNLADNTNLWGPPPAAAAAIAAAATEAVGYPSLYGEALKDAVAGTFGVAPEAVVTGCGSDNVLDATMRAFAGPGRRVVYSAPTFVMLSVFGTLSGATVVPVPFAADGDIDPAALLAADGDVTYICAPNNPTAVAPTPAHVDRVIADARGLVVIDEAYAEFSGISWLTRAAANDRVVVARTFSKAYGLAGVRAGFGVAAPGIIAAIERARGPYTLNVIAERA
ncbi:MAG: histidinol-phosphate transaminase, partial [Gemmatimonadaceae bacterium]|nr:histidinol-phosphate transaminase [Gemmatimonadaceae bacterium]